ncbi:MAG: glycosyltransferase [Bacteroidota bacterium]|nr:glycosyltransferase [Bacteroidota bacterium]
MLKILHLAPQNYAGVPYDFYKMHLACGDFSRLITYHKNQLNFEEDICLNLPLPIFRWAKKWRRKKVSDREFQFLVEAPVFTPKNRIEEYYFKFNDFYKKHFINNAIRKYKLDEFDIIHYDAGLDFYRDSRQAIKWKQQGKKIVCCYYGSDLRTRGLIKKMDELSDLNITSEYDHLKLKGNLNYLFYPYDTSELPGKANTDDSTVTIIHTPTNRKYKGTELIIKVIDRIKLEKKIKFVLLENVSRDKVLLAKSKSDICIDQVGGTMGGTGYGKAGLESLAMGIPTVTNMTNEYAEWLPENPFTVANNEDELYLKLSELVESAELRKETGLRGIDWVKKYHSYESVNNKLYELYKLNKLI